MATPPLPPGFQLVSPEAAGIPELPPGFRLVQQPQKSGAAMATEEMSGLDRFLAGAGYGATATAQGLGQLGERVLSGTDVPGEAGAIERIDAYLKNALGPMAAMRMGYRAITGDGENRGRIRDALQGQINEDRRLYDQGIGQTGAGFAGNLSGAVAASAPLGALALPVRGASVARGIGAAAGTGALQSMLTNPTTGDGSDFATQKALQGVTGAVVGGGVNAGLRGLGALAERLLPANATASVINALSGKASRSDFAQEGEQLARRTGVELTPAAITGGKAQTMAENMARQSMFSRDLAFDADAKIAQQVTDYIGRVAKGVSKTGEDSATVGNRVAGTVAKEVDRLASRRADIGGRLYGEVDQLAKGAPVVQPNALRQQLQAIVDENKGIVDADAKKALAWASAQIKALDTDASLSKLIRNRRFWSAASAGKGNIFENASPGMQQRTAARVLEAIDQDLEEAGKSLPGPIGEKLQRANAVWRQYSQAIEGVEASPLGQLMGEEFSAAASRPGQMFSSTAPEKWVAKIKTLEPSQVSLVRDFLQRKNPEAWQSLKRRVLEDALEAGQNAAPSEGARTIAIRGNAFINALARTPKDQARLRGMYSAKELREIDDAFSVIRRWGDKTGTNFSGTAPAAEALGFMNTLKDVALKGSASAAGQVLGVRSVARLMNDQGGRAALLQLRRLPPQSAQARQLVSYIAAVAAGKEVQAGDEQQQGYDPNAEQYRSLDASAGRQ